MQLLGQSMKAQMEECKKRARAAGLEFPDNTLEYIVSNQDMLLLRPKIGIPTLYDYWAQDVEVVRSKWEYDVFPNNPYEMVINTRPPISYYLSDNTDWFNVMIFYHVLGHIDFFQNNVFFRNTWDDDFCGQALADKRLIERIREERGAEKRWVDYVIEFTLAIDNLVGYHQELGRSDAQDAPAVFAASPPKVEFYFGQFLRQRYEEKTIDLQFYYDEIERYNRRIKQLGADKGEAAFFQDNKLRSKFPEFNSVFKKWQEKGQKPKPTDLLEHLMENSDFLNREENCWMKDVIQVVRRTSLYFQAQMRERIANEGWASFWHQRLFIPDERIQGHEVDFALVDSGVTTNPRVGLNPYAVGKNIFEFIEDLARKGRLSPDYQFLKDIEARKRYDRHCGDEYAKQALFGARKYLDDYLLVNFLSPQDFQDFVDQYNYFVVGVRPSRTEWGMADYYIKSRKGEDFRALINQGLYHPPHIVVNEEKAKDGELYLDHTYEGRSLVLQFIPQVLVGLEFLWGKRVRLETTVYEEVKQRDYNQQAASEHRIHRVVYTCKDKKVTIAAS